MPRLSNVTPPPGSPTSDPTTEARSTSDNRTSNVIAFPGADLRTLADAIAYWNRPGAPHQRPRR